MKRREIALFCAAMAAMLAVLYAPQMMKPGGIRFGVIQDITGVYGFVPWDTFTMREFRAGYFPLWNPHNALGEPHLANMQSAVFYPLTWLKIAAGMRPTVLDLTLVLRLLLAGLFAFMFLGDLGIKLWPRVIGACSFAVTGYFTRHVYMSHLNVEILLPLVMYSFGRLARMKRRRDFFLAAIAVWLSVAGGFPEAALYSLPLGAIWYMYSCGRGKVLRGLPAAMGAISLGLILSLPQWLAFLEYMVNAWTYHKPGVGAAHANLKYAFTLISPWFFGANDVSPLEPFLTPYIGAAVTALAAMGAMRADRKGLFFIASSIALFGVIYGIYPFILVGKIYPFSVTLNYKYAVPAFAFCISVLAAMGLDDVLDKPSWKKSALAAGVPALIIAGAFLLNHMGSFLPYYRLGENKWAVYALMSLAAVFVLPAMARNGGRYAIYALLLVSVMYPAYGNRPKYNADFDKAPAEYKAGRYDAIGHNARFAAENVLFPDLNLAINLNDIRYYNPMYLRNYVNLFARANGLTSPEEIVANFADHAILQPDRDRLADPLWAKMGLEYWIGGPPGSYDLLPDLIKKAGWKTESREMISRSVFFDDMQVLFAHAPAKVSLKMAIPANYRRLTLVPAMDPKTPRETDGVVFEVRIDNKTAYLKYVSKPAAQKPQPVNIDVSPYQGRSVELAFITTPGPHGDKTADFAGWGEPYFAGDDMGNWEEAENGIYRARRIRKTANTSGQSFTVASTNPPGEKFITANAWYPGWRAYDSNGTELKIEPAEGGFQSVASAGNVMFEYRPVSFAIGLWAFITGAFFMIFCAVFSPARNRPDESS